MCFVGVFSFFNVNPISVLQSIFKFFNSFFTVRAFVGRFNNWSLRCFIGFNCEDNKKIIWQISFYYDWPEVIVAFYTIGDNVVYGICWVSGYPRWFICQMNHIIKRNKRLWKSWPDNLKVENLNFCWKICRQLMFLKNKQC